MNIESRFYILTIFGTAFGYTLYSSYHYDNIFAIFFYLIFGGITIYVYYNNLFDNDGKYKNLNCLKKSATFIFGTLLILINLGIYGFFEVKLHAKTLLKAENYGLNADFKKNGQYIIKSGAWASKKHFYGNYSISDSLITLDRKYFDDVLVTNKLVIRDIVNAFGDDQSDKSKKYLIELDKNYKEIKNRLVGYDESKNEIYLSFKFEIIEDNRE